MVLLLEPESNKNLYKNSYVAPEVLLTQVSDTAADLWSFGCIIYELFMGKTPFKAHSAEDQYAKVLKGDFSIPEKVIFPIIYGKI